MSEQECREAWGKLTKTQLVDFLVNKQKQLTSKTVELFNLKKEAKKWLLEDVQELHDFLKGKTPENFNLKKQPKLTDHEAFTIIYVLQEHFSAISDDFEMCERCHIIIDSANEGHFFEDLFNLCDTCINEIAPNWDASYRVNGIEMLNAVKAWDASRKSDKMEEP